MNLLTATTSFLATGRFTNVTARGISNAYFKLKPRPYKRRLYEAAVAHVLPPPPKNAGCLIRENYEKPKQELQDIEIALAKHVRKILIEKRIKIMVICQRLHKNRRWKHFANQDIGAHGLEYREYGRNIMQALFEKTPLESLLPIFKNHSCILIGSNVEKSLKCLFEVVPQHDHLAPLLVVIGQRIYRLTDLRDMAKMTDKEHRVETFDILNQAPLAISYTISSPANEIAYILSQVETSETEPAQNVESSESSKSESSETPTSESLL